jgi:hypothetical protein
MKVDDLVHKSSPFASYSEPEETIPVILSYFLQIYFNIILLPTPSLPSGLFILEFP